MNGLKISKRAKSNLLLILVAIIWGTSFVAQKRGVGTLKPNTFNGIRTMLGALALVPVILFQSRIKKDEPAIIKQNPKILIKAGIICGILLCSAGTTQTVGLLYADAGKAGFITALYIILVPLFGVIAGKRLKPLLAVGVAAATVGLYFLCVKDFGSFRFEKGDLWLFACAILFSFHILAIDYFSPQTDGVKLSCLQFFVSASINIVLMFIFEKPVLSEILSCWFPIFYAGVMSCGVAYTLQVVAQKNTDPTVASILMSMESFFALLAGIAFGETPSARKLIGCAFMMAAIILAQLPDKKGDKNV